MLAALLAGCAESGGSDGDKKDAKALWEEILALDYQSFDRAPGYETTQPSEQGAHGDTVDIFIDPTVADALAAGDALEEWPVDSLIVKDGFRPKNTQIYVAAMKKADDGWFWAEYDPDGTVLDAGQPSLCTGCHIDAHNDFVWSVPLP